MRFNSTTVAAVRLANARARQLQPDPQVGASSIDGFAGEGVEALACSLDVLLAAQRVPVGDGLPQDGT